MKNLYGTVSLLDRPFLTGLPGVLRFHLNACDPCVAEVNALVAEKVPTVLYVCDGLFGMYNDGPWGTDGEAATRQCVCAGLSLRC